MALEDIQALAKLTRESTEAYVIAELVRLEVGAYVRGDQIETAADIIESNAKVLLLLVERFREEAKGL